MEEPGALVAQEPGLGPLPIDRLPGAALLPPASAVGQLVDVAAAIALELGGDMTFPDAAHTGRGDVSVRMTSPTKVPCGNLGRIGKMRDTDRNSLQRKRLSGRARRLSHSLSPIHVNVRSILLVTSKFGVLSHPVAGGTAMPTCLAKLLAIPILVGCMLNLYVTGWSAAEGPGAGPGLFDRGNLVAWCIVPFDGKRRGPEERAAMLERLGFRHFAY